MDDRLKQALDFTKYRISLFNRKEDLKIQLQSTLTYAFNGGLFAIDQSLLTFVDMIIRQGRERVVLIDKNGNPIEITDLQGFFDEIFSRYFEATNLYLVEYTKLKSARSVSSIYDFIDK